MAHLDRLPGRFFGPATLVEMVRHRAHCQPKDIAFTYLVDGENEAISLTYEELDRQARAIGAWLESLGLAGESLRLARDAASAGQEELAAAEIRVALEALGTVVGAVYTEDLLDRIFSRFCVGK